MTIGREIQGFSVTGKGWPHFVFGGIDGQAQVLGLGPTVVGQPGHVQVVLTGMAGQFIGRHIDDHPAVGADGGLCFFVVGGIDGSAQVAGVRPAAHRFHGVEQVAVTKGALVIAKQNAEVGITAHTVQGLMGVRTEVAEGFGVTPTPIGLFFSYPDIFPAMTARSVVRRKIHQPSIG